MLLAASQLFAYAQAATDGVEVGLDVLGAVSALAMVFLNIGVALFLAHSLEPPIHIPTRWRLHCTSAAGILERGSLLILVMSNQIVTVRAASSAPLNMFRTRVVRLSERCSQ